MNSHLGGACPLESVIATAQLDNRTSRLSDPHLETQTHLELARELAESPGDFFLKLVQAALKISKADSTGISLLNESRDSFVWPAVAGPLDPYLWGGTPRDFGPCGTVLDRKAPVLFQHPERHFDYLVPINPPLEEVLLIPFFIDDEAVGTLWAVIHEKDRHFEPEDRRLLEGLSTFASSAYRIMARTGVLTPMIRRQPGQK